MIQPIPARGMRPSKMESNSITGNNRPPRKNHVASVYRLQRRPPQRAPLQEKLLRSGLKGHVDGFGVLGRQSDFDGLLAHFFLDEGQCVVARWQALDFEF